MKAWLKGGLIGGTILLLWSIITPFTWGTSIKSLFYFIYNPLINFPLRTFSFLLFSITSQNSYSIFFIIGKGGIPKPSIISYIIIFLLYFIIGALIGWIIGKIKSKK